MHVNELFLSSIKGQNSCNLFLHLNKLAADLFIGFRMSWLRIIIFFSFIFSNVSEAKHQKKLPSAVVVGTVYCDTCFHKDFSKASHFIAGASVAVECKDIGPRSSFRQEVKTNEHGEFRVHLPFSVSKHVKKIQGCSVKLISSSEPYCAVAAIATSSSLHLKSRKEGKHIFSAGFFSFKPLNQPEVCDQKPSIKNPKNLNSQKSLASNPAFVPPISNPNDPTFLPPIRDPPASGQLLPPLPQLPNLPPLLPQLPPLPPLQGIPFPPINKATQELDKKVAQPNDLFPPIIPLPPNPLNPPSFLPPNPFQPPPSLLPPNPFQPPPSIIPPIFPSPPPSILPPLIPTPSTPPSFNFPPIPGITPVPSPPPPSFPFIPLPPFPFQPTPGFPGIPPADISSKQKTSTP